MILNIMVGGNEGKKLATKALGGKGAMMRDKHQFVSPGERNCFGPEVSPDLGEPLC